MNDVSRSDPLTRARELAPAVAAAADETERIRRIPEPLVDELHAARLFRMLYPRSVGGDEVAPATYIDAVGELARADGSLRLNDAGRPTVRTWLFPVEQAVLLNNWDPIGLRGTASESYMVEDLFVPEEFTGTREDPSLRREPGALYAFPQQTLYSVGIASVALGIARGMLDAFVELASRKTPRGTGRLADNSVIQAKVAHAEARLGAASIYLLETVGEIYRRAGPTAPIDVMDRARARLAGSHAISSAVAVADYTYKAAGVDAIFPDSPFERRFRDIHTLSQQIQSRDAHYEAVGQVLLGHPPEVFF